MKKVTILTILLAFLLSSCSHSKSFNTSITETIQVEPYGLVNAKDLKQDTVVYQICTGNVVWACILCETIIAPMYFKGIP